MSTQIRVFDQLERVLGSREAAYEARRGDAHHRAQERVKPERDHRRRRVAERRQDRNGKGRLRPEEPVADESGGAGGERYGEKGAHAHFRHHQLDREHDAADRRVESCRDAGAGARADQRDALPRIEP
jgi:hypothetical protein